MKILMIGLFLFWLAGCAASSQETPQSAPSLTGEPASAITASPEPLPSPTLPIYIQLPTPEEPSYIPRELVVLVTQAIGSNTVDETLSPLDISKSVSDEELLSLMEEEGQPEGLWDHLRYYVGSEPTLFQDYIVFEADGDNDGILDLIAVTTGGSAGNTGLEFFQGRAEGGYQKTYQAYIFLPRSRYGFISFEGRQYFWNVNISYATKGYSGLSLYAFQDGVPVEEVSINREIDGYSEDVRQGETFYTDKLARMTFELQENDGGFPQRAGTAERKDTNKAHYWGDLDNDGVEEAYNKRTWFPTTYFSVVEIDFEYEKGYVGQAVELLNIMNEHGYAVQTLWCDKEEHGNVVYTISRDSGNNLSADAWQYRENMWEHLAQVLFTPEYSVDSLIYTQNINIDFLDTKAFM